MKIKNNKQTCNQKGITLISLIITIIILIILAGVVINLSFDDNGILNRAKYAKEQTVNAQKKEQIQINDIDNQILTATSRQNEDEIEKIVNQKLAARSAMTVTCDNSISVTGERKKVTLSTINASTGSNLTLYEGGIKIGKGISNIMVSASGYINATDSKEFSLVIYKNDSSLYLDSDRESGTTMGITTANYLVNVSENDVIYLYVANTSGGGTFKKTTLSVFEY